MIGIGQGLGLPLPLVAGSIISGSYFGDKMSPLSDTTNLAPAVAGVDMFTHIRHMMYTAVPSFIIAGILYTIIGFFFTKSSAELGDIVTIQNVLQQNFNLSPWMFIPPLAVIAMVVMRVPALPALLFGSILGGVFALIFQSAPLGLVINVAQNGYLADTGYTAVDELLSRGGLESMMSTVALIMCALAFGGVMEHTGMLESIASAILRLAKSTGQLAMATVLTCISMNVLAPDQYLSIVVPGRMYRSTFQKRKLAPQNLSRCLEDGGTLTSSLVPWNTGGAYMWVTLGVYPLAYLPFAFVNLLSPMINILLGFTGWTMTKDLNQSDIQDDQTGETR